VITNLSIAGYARSEDAALQRVAMLAWCLGKLTTLTGANAAPDFSGEKMMRRRSPVFTSLIFRTGVGREHGRTEANAQDSQGQSTKTLPQVAGRRAGSEQSPIATGVSSTFGSHHNFPPEFWRKTPRTTMGAKHKKQRLVYEHVSAVN